MLQVTVNTKYGGGVSNIEVPEITGASPLTNPGYTDILSSEEADTFLTAQGEIVALARLLWGVLFHT